MGAVFQAQSRYSSWGSRDLSTGGLAGALGSMMLLPDFVSVASTSLTSFLLTSEPRSPPSRNQPCELTNSLLEILILLS